MKSSVNVTLAISTYNSAPFLPELFESLKRLKTLPRQIFFNDDGSKDNTVQLCREFAAQHPDMGIQVHQNPKNMGIVDNWNRIIDLAGDSEWLQILDADDYLLEDFYTPLVDELPKAGEANIVVTSMRTAIPVFNSFLKVFEKAAPRQLPRWFQVQGSIATKSGLLYRTRKIKQTPYFGPVFDGWEIRHTYKFMDKNYYVPHTRVFYRIHGGSTTSSHNDMLAPYKDYIRSLPGMSRGYYWLDFMMRKQVLSFLRNKTKSAH